MAGVVNYAANRLRFAGGDVATTLKVFIAPEFYFRPQNAENAYTFNQMTNILAALRSMFVHADFADWLFVPGSIFSSSRRTPASTSRTTSALISTRPAWSRAARRMRRSTSCTSARFRISTGRRPIEAALHNANFQSLLADWNERKNNVWRCDNRTFGIEVCLDHLDSPNSAS